MRKSKPSPVIDLPAAPGAPVVAPPAAKPKDKFFYRDLTQADIDDCLVKYFREHPLYGKDPALTIHWSELVDEKINTDEIAGKKANKFVVLAHSYTHVGEAGLSDETAWCASVQNMKLICCGFKGSRKGTKGNTSAAATSLGEVGEEMSELVPGAILVIQHLTGSLKGHYHTTEFVRRSSSDKNIIYCRGGNQGNTFCIQAYDLRKEKIVHIRYNFKPLAAA